MREIGSKNFPFDGPTFCITTPRLLEILTTLGTPQIVWVIVGDNDITERVATWGDVVAEPNNISLRYEEDNHLLWVFTGDWVPSKATQTLAAANRQQSMQEIAEAAQALAGMTLPPGSEPDSGRRTVH